MEILKYILIGVAVLALLNYKVFLTVFRYKKVKKKYEGFKNEYISVHTEAIALKMEDTLNNLSDIKEGLTKASENLSGYNLEKAEYLIELSGEMHDEYFKLQEEISSPGHDQESLNAFEKKLDRFSVRINNELAIGVRQLLSRLKNELA